MNTKSARCGRAMVLNQQKLSERFIAIPWRIGKTQPIESLEKGVLDALSYEWDEGVVFKRRIITRDKSVFIINVIQVW